MEEERKRKKNNAFISPHYIKVVTENNREKREYPP
jgi:hypothetical protein